MRSFVADSNFKVQHLKQKSDAIDVWLTHGEEMTTETTHYEMHLEKAKETKLVNQ
jgi:hypothetical protein